MGTIEDSEKGLVLHGELDLELPEAKTAYRRIKKRMVKGLSIGFKSAKDSIQDGIRRLKEIRLYEVSLVTFPLNEKAKILAVKAMHDDPEMAELMSEMAEHMGSMNKIMKRMMSMMKFDGLIEQADELLNEAKAGRRISSASRGDIEAEAAIEKFTNAIGILRALLEEEAVEEDTSKSQPPPAVTAEPETLHSLLKSFAEDFSVKARAIN